MYHKNFELLLETVPVKARNLFRNILSTRLNNDIELHDFRGRTWQYWGYTDNVLLDTRDNWVYLAECFPDKLSSNMYVYDDLVVFVEHKGVHGYVNPVVKLFNLSEGFIRL